MPSLDIAQPRRHATLRLRQCPVEDAGTWAAFRGKTWAALLFAVGEAWAVTRRNKFRVTAAANCPGGFANKTRAGTPPDGDRRPRRAKNETWSSDRHETTRRLRHARAVRGYRCWEKTLIPMTDGDCHGCFSPHADEWAEEVAWPVGTRDDLPASHAPVTFHAALEAGRGADAGRGSHVIVSIVPTMRNVREG